jgi:hypothetical protein
MVSSLGFFTIVLAYTIVFAGYLELSPKIGNVWYRMGVDGFRHIKIENLLAFMIKPLTMIELWYPWNWDINYILGLGLCFILYLTLSNGAVKFYVSD